MRFHLEHGRSLGVVSATKAKQLPDDDRVKVAEAVILRNSFSGCRWNFARSM